MKRKCGTYNAVFGFLLASLLSLYLVAAVPVGPTVTYKSNSTLGNTPAVEVNYTGNGTTQAGGYIYTINLNSNQQNNRWKAYVGNVTGTLVLADASGYSIYDWSVTTSLTGEVYATRASGTVNWSNINCAFNNATYWENRAINHTNPNDNISTTFDGTDNSAFSVGTVSIGASACPTTNIYVNSTSPADDSFEQVLLYDGSQTNLSLSTNANFRNLVYTAIIETDHDSYKNDTLTTYDFQMILPERGLASWQSATAYYFYVELT